MMIYDKTMLASRSMKSSIAAVSRIVNGARQVLERIERISLYTRQKPDPI